MIFRKKHIASFLLLLTVLLAAHAAVNGLKGSNAPSAFQARLDAVVREGLRTKAYPGCQLVVLKDGQVVCNKSYGYQTFDRCQPVTEQTVYDLASLSKTTGTLLAVMKLFDEGKLSLTDSLARFLPVFRGTDKAKLTVAQLLVHETGLPASLNAHSLVTSRDTAHRTRIASTWYNDSLISFGKKSGFTLLLTDSVYLSDAMQDSALAKIVRMKLLSETYRYSCVNFMLLKAVCEAVSGQSMDVFLQMEFYEPMGLKRTTYRPLDKLNPAEIAPSMRGDFLRNTPLRGWVQDPDAALLGGVSGNAGLFSTAMEVARIHQLLLNEGELDGKRFLSAATCRLFTTMTSLSGRRGLGFDKPVPSAGKNNPCCAAAPRQVYGHTGYTGTCCWVDPELKLIFVFLSNRTYPDDRFNRLSRLQIRPRLQAILYQTFKQ